MASISIPFLSFSVKKQELLWKVDRGSDVSLKNLKKKFKVGISFDGETIKCEIILRFSLQENNNCILYFIIIIGSRLNAQI